MYPDNYIVSFFLMISTNFNLTFVVLGLFVSSSCFNYSLASPAVCKLLFACTVFNFFDLITSFGTIKQLACFFDAKAFCFVW